MIRVTSALVMRMCVCAHACTHMRAQEMPRGGGDPGDPSHFRAWKACECAAVRPPVRARLRTCVDVGGGVHAYIERAIFHKVYAC